MNKSTLISEGAMAQPYHTHFFDEELSEGSVTTSEGPYGSHTHWFDQNEEFTSTDSNHKHRMRSRGGSLLPKVIPPKQDLSLIEKEFPIRENKLNMTPMEKFHFKPYRAPGPPAGDAGTEKGD